MREGEDGPEPPPRRAQEVGRGRSSFPGGQHGEVAVHLVLPHRMALQRGAAPLYLLRQVFSQRVHVADDQVRDYPGGERVTGPAVGGHYQVGAFCDGLDQTFRVRSSVQEDRGPHAI